MAELLVMDRATVQTNMSGVASACVVVDGYYGPMRHDFATLKQEFYPAGPLDQLQITVALEMLQDGINNWFGDGGKPSQRGLVANAAIAPFGDAGAAGFVAPLQQVSAIQHDLLASGQPATADQVAAATAAFQTASGWMDQVTAQMDAATSTFDTVMTYLKTLHEFAENVVDEPGSMVGAFKRSITLDEAAETAVVGLRTGWTTVRDLTHTIAQRVTAAEALTLVDILQVIDVAASLNEWQSVCALAQSLKPGPPPAP